MLKNNVQIELAAIWFTKPIEIVRNKKVIKRAFRITVGDEIRVDDGFVSNYGLTTHKVIACMNLTQPYFKCISLTDGNVSDVQIM